MPLIPQEKQRYVRSPAFVASSESPLLQVVVWTAEGERLERFPLALDGTPGEPEVLEYVTGGIVALEPGDAPAPTDDPDAELRARDGQAIVRITHASGESIVTLERGEARVIVFRAHGSVMAPAVACDGAGTWVAFHHDVREDTRVPDVSKWIALRFVDAAGNVFEPRAEMLDRDRDREGVEQSFEFPALVVGEDGALALFGRGSHDFFRQDLSAAGFTKRVGLTDGEWGSRGRRPTAKRFGARTLVAFRDRKGVVVLPLDSPSGGRPELVAADIDFTPSARITAREARPDPAARHGLRTAFGDIQQHSAHSDGVGTADEAYLRARHRYGDDFVALTDHESFIGKRTGPGEWRYLQAVATKHDVPGTFATLYAYEWTGARYPGPGHKCVYMPREGLPLVSRDDVPVGRALVQAIKSIGGVASPHHIGWTGCDEEGHDPVGQPVFEICSCHGCYEHADHPLGQRGDLTHQLVDVMLKKGHRFGFTASSDSHGLLYHHGEARKRDPYRTGLTAVQIPSLHRDDILRALHSRRCYATSGAKILLDVLVNGAPMGSELDTDGPLSVEVVAHGEDTLARIEVIGPSGVLAHEAASARAHAARFTVKDDYVYVRVTQADGEMAWSSPVFSRPASSPSTSA